MKTIIKQCFFPDSECEVLHQNGVRIGEPSKGVEITFYSQENGTEPCSAELISGELSAEIGLTFKGKVLSDYDGVFNLPHEVSEVLKDAGYIVPEDFFVESPPRSKS